jgi:mRNA interferase MazF
LALSSERFSADSGHTVFAMITSADNPPWPMDVAFDPVSSGLRSASKMRMKLFTLDNRLILRKAGSLSAGDRQAVASALHKLLPGPSSTVAG